MDKEFLEYQIDNFDKLCHRAKEIIFEGLITGNNKFKKLFEQCGIAQDIVDSTPIEQILYFSLPLYWKIENGIQIYPQKEIICNGHTYKVDIYIEYVRANADENKYSMLKHPLVIECDGYEYHSSKEQMQYDYERENNLKLAGYNIIRFTGSQIYSNSQKCIAIIEQTILNAITNKEYKGEE